jgi:thiamine-phosphate pyrophosphorylase
LYTFIDTAYLAGRSPEALATQLCEGGADLIQLRAKDLSFDRVHQMAATVQPITSRFGVRLVINDCFDIATEVNAELCHLGQEDFFDSGYSSVDQLKQGKLSPGVGLSTHSPEQAQRAVKAGADYIAVGPVFATGTKPSASPVGLKYVRWAAANIRIPWFAIGGITLKNIDEVLAAGARRIAVVSAILRAPDVTGACQEFKQRLASAAN